MHELRMPILAIGCSLAIWTAVPPSAVAQGSGNSRYAVPQATRPMTPDEFYQSFWQHLVRQQSPYTTWPPLAGTGELRDAKSPHGPIVKVVANTPANDPAAVFPYGAIVVIENYGSDGKTLKHLDVMYRAKGSNPPANDWYWLKYLPDGSIARGPDGKRAIAGKVALCIECHVKAHGKDYVYFNDPKPQTDKK